MQQYIFKFMAMFLLFYCHCSVALIMSEDTTWTLDKSPYKLTECTGQAKLDTFS
jgi:hypothetical protein